MKEQCVLRARGGGPGVVLTDSPGRGLSCPSMTDILASCSSLRRVWTVFRAESISKGPHASWACGGERWKRIWRYNKNVSPLHWWAGTDKPPPPPRYKPQRNTRAHLCSPAEWNRWA